MRFTKMQGSGNDYVYLDCTERTPDNLPNLANQLSDRHFGIGGDGIICLCSSKRADFGMMMFNADGSQGEMCGNGIRCLGKYIYDHGFLRQQEVTIETLAGIKKLRMLVKNGTVTDVTVDMGLPHWGEPLALDIDGTPWRGRPVSMGNPHFIIFQEGIDHLPVTDLGPKFEYHPAFPHRTNTEFVEVVSPHLLRMRVWERGSGETLACGTGACAAVVAAAAEGRADREADVNLRGGMLHIAWDQTDGRVYLTGSAVTVFEGEIPLTDIETTRFPIIVGE